MPTVSSSSRTLALRALLSPIWWTSSGSPMMSPIVMRLFRLAYGSWKIICMRLRCCAQAAALEVGEVAALVEHAAGGGPDELQDGAPGGALAAAALAHEAERLAALDVEREAVHGVHGADLALEHDPAGDGEVDAQVLDADEGVFVQRGGGGAALRWRRSNRHLRRLVLAQLARVEAGREAGGVGGLELGHGRPALVRRQVAARCECAARRQVRQVGRQAGDGLQRVAPRLVEARHALEQPDRVRVVRMLEEGLGRAAFDDAPGVHDQDALAHAGHHAEVVGDHDHRRLVLARELLEQAQDLRLDGHVQRGRRLVGEQQLGVAGQRDGDHHALAHAAAELVWIVLDAAGRLGDAHLAQQLDGAGDRLGVAHVQVHLEALGHQPLDAEHRVQAGDRVLEDHRDVAAADGADVALREREQVAAHELDGDR